MIISYMLDDKFTRCCICKFHHVPSVITNCRVSVRISLISLVTMVLQTKTLIVDCIEVFATVRSWQLNTI